MMSKKKYKKLKKKYKNFGKKKKNKKKGKVDYNKLRYKDFPMYFKEDDKVVINKVNLSAYDSFLLEAYPDKYTTQSSQMYKEESVKRRNTFLKKLESKEKEDTHRNVFKIWNEYAKYEKNPEKYYKKGGMSKQEKQIMKYFNKIKSSKGGKDDKLKEVIKEMKKCNDLSKLSLLMDEYDQSKLIIEMNKRKHKKWKYKNPNYSFSHNKYKNMDNDDRDMMLINALDEEINKRLCSDNIFSPNNLATDYEKDKHKKKKKKKININDIII